MTEKKFRLRGVVVQKWLIWIGLIAAVFLLRHLFPILLFTFILAYIGNSILTVAQRNRERRRLILVGLYIAFVLALVGISILVVPRLLSEARGLAQALLLSEQVPVEKEIPTIGPASIGVPERTATEVVPPPPSFVEREVRQTFDSIILRLLGEDTLRELKLDESYEVLIERIEVAVAAFIPRVVTAVRELVNGILQVTMQFVLSILLSFLVLWDLPRLRRGTRSLATGRTAEIYREVAPSMKAFALIIGRAFEAQTLVALVNTILTGILFFILGLPSISLLCTIVFLCSYIPVAGVFLSTVPAALLALNAGGVSTVVWLIIGILVIHTIEAYALNPIIYGHHMRLHPLAVLVILLIGEHLLGIWGLILGVPIAVFVYRYLIRGDTVDKKPVPHPKSESNEPTTPEAATA